MGMRIDETMKMKILLVSINARYSHSSPAVYYLRESLRGLQHKTEIREFSISSPFQKIMDEIEHLKPEITAFSVYIWNGNIVGSLIRQIKKASPGIKIILGGPEAGYNANEWLNNFPEIDFIISGPGENAFRFLAEKNFLYDKKILSMENIHFSEIPFPYTQEDLESFKGKYIYYESSRGCPFRCTYCISSRAEQRLEFRELEKVFQEIEFISRFNPDTVKFIDRSFNADKIRAREIWDHLIKKYSGSGIRFHFEIFPGLIDNEDADILESAPDGLFQLEVGLQSLNATAIEAVWRNRLSGDKIFLLKKIISRGNIHVHLDQIAGLPYDDFASVLKSANEILKMKPSHFQLGFLKVLPGTEIYDEKVKFGIVCKKEAPYQIIKSDYISEKEIVSLELIAESIDRFYNSCKFMVTMENIFELAQPIHFFEYTSKFFLRNDWEFLADRVISFVRENFLSYEKFFTDCLRWDWCKTGGLHRYPKIIKPDNYEMSRKDLFKLFAPVSENGSKYAGRSFSRDELKSSILFIPESDDFRKKYMQNYDMAIFLSDKRVEFIDKL